MSLIEYSENLSPFRRMSVHQAYRFSIYAAAFFGALTYFRIRPYNFLVADLFVVLSLILLFYLATKSPTIIIRFSYLSTAWVAGVTLLVIGLLLSSIVNGSSPRTFSVSIQYLFGFAILPLAFENIKGNYMDVIAFWFLGGMAVVGVVATTSVYFDIGPLDLERLSGRTGSLLDGPNRLGLMIALTIPMLLLLWHQKKLSTVLFFSTSVMLIIALMASGSVSGLIVTTLTISVYLVMTLRMGFILRVLGAVCALFIIFVFVVPPPESWFRATTFLTTGQLEDAGTYEKRAQLASHAWYLIQQSPFIGIGADSFREIQGMDSPVHNTYLLLWVEGGISSLVGWVIIVSAPIVLGFYYWFREETRQVGAALVSVGIAFALAASTFPHFYQRSWMIPVIIMGGIAISSSRNRNCNSFNQVVQNET